VPEDDDAHPKHFIKRCACVCVRTCIDVCVCVYIYIYIYIHFHSCLVYVYIYIQDMNGSIPYGGGLEYLHCSPASHKRQQKKEPVPGVISGPPSSWGK
jgi:hypothetical protein